MSSESNMARYESNPDVVLTAGDQSPRKIKRKFSQSLASVWIVPALVLLGFITLGVVTQVLDHSDRVWLQNVRGAIQRYFFADWQVTEAFMRNVGGGLMTLMSITFSMLMIMLQQASNNLGNLIFDQFLRRGGNQLYAGYLIGSTFLAYYLNPTTTEEFIPVFGATVVLLTLLLSVLFLAMFTYSMIDQMRPETITRMLHRATLETRERQRRFLARTRRLPEMEDGHRVTLRSTVEGRLVRIDLDHVQECLEATNEPVEIVMRASLGAHIVYLDPIAEVHSAKPDAARQVAEALGDAFRFEDRRELTMDAAYGILLLETMAFAAASSARRSSDTSQQVAHAFRDLLTRWMEQGTDGDGADVLPFVYQDSVPADTLDAMQSLMVASIEAEQHLTMSVGLTILADIYARLTPELQERTLEVVLRTLPELDSVPFTREMDVALSTLAETFDAYGVPDVAKAVRQTRSERADRIPVHLDAPPGRRVDRRPPALGQEVEASR